MLKQKMSIIIFLTITLLFYLGCSKLTEENYSKIKMGMDSSEVLSIIGNADECSDKLGIKNCKWGSSEKYIKVDFVANKVVLTSKKGL